MPGIVKLYTLLYFTLAACATNPEDSVVYNQCILFACRKFTFASGCWYLMIDSFWMFQFFKEHFAFFLMLWAETHVANIIHRNIVLQIFLPVCINKFSVELSTDLSTGKPLIVGVIRNVVDKCLLDYFQISFIYQKNAFFPVFN